MKPKAPTNRGIIARQQQERIEADIVAGERRYWASVMADEISNDPDFYEGDL